MMYWDFPERARGGPSGAPAALDASRIRLGHPRRHGCSLGVGQPAARGGGSTLLTAARRTVFGMAARAPERIVYADTGEEQWEADSADGRAYCVHLDGPVRCARREGGIHSGGSTRRTVQELLRNAASHFEDTLAGRASRCTFPASVVRWCSIRPLQSPAVGFIPRRDSALASSHNRQLRKQSAAVEPGSSSGVRVWERWPRCWGIAIGI